jgi:hypothetical protein
MGNFGSGNLSSHIGWYYPVRNQNGTHKWFIRLFEDLEFRIKTADRWFDLRENIFSNSKLLADIDRYALLLDETQVRNFQRWDTLGRQVDYNPPGWTDRDTYQKEVDWLKTWLEDRLAWMDQAIAQQRAPDPPVFYIDGIEHNDDGYVPTGSTLSISSKRGNIYYTLDGSDPRLGNDNGISPTAHEYIDPMTLTQNVTVKARALSGNAWSALNKATYSVELVTKKS